MAMWCEETTMILETHLELNYSEEYFHPHADKRQGVCGVYPPPHPKEKPNKNI